MLRRATLIATTLLAMVPIAAWAQTTPESARALQQQVQNWIATTLGPDVRISKDIPFRITPAGDHYQVEVPLGDGPNALVVTATAREQIGGRWAIENIHIPSPAEFQLKMPDSVAASNPTMAGPLNYKLTIAEQAGTVLLDPSFATPTTSTSSIQGLDLVATGPTLEQHSHLDRGTGTTVMTPAPNGRADIVITSQLEGYTIDSKTIDSKKGAPKSGDPASSDDRQPLKIGIGRARMNATFDNVSRERFVQLLQTLPKLGAKSSNKASPDTPAPLPTAALLELVSDLATGMTIDEAFDDLSFGVQGMDASLKATKLGLAAKSTDGLLQAMLDLGAEGLTLPDLGLGAMADLIPTKISLRPTVSGIPTEAAIRMIKASGDGNAPAPSDIAALFARGGITAGLDSLTVELAGSTFTGNGKMLFTSPTEYAGAAQITATNLDALQQRLAADPTTAQAGPVIIFLKGVGRTVDNKMVWDLVYRDRRLLVNNQDLTALTGGGPSAAPAPQGEPKRPVPPPANGQPQLRRKQ